MKPKVKAQWVAALRSGDYTQTQGRLRRDGGFCCLGVLCDLYRQETGKGAWDGGNLVWGGKTLGEAILGRVVCDWAGLTSSNPYINDDKNATLTGMNDHGASFKEIAAVIEAKL